jgi:hypothetical protein
LSQFASLLRFYKSKEIVRQMAQASPRQEHMEAPMKTHRQLAWLEFLAVVTVAVIALVADADEAIAQQAQIVRLTSQVTAIQTSLKATSRADSRMRNVRAQERTVRQ